ncbi:MAG: carboxypeptidase regulatory-like domain-containing protein [Candidatus Neomarinimicrobiota bacterium]
MVSCYSSIISFIRIIPILLIPFSILYSDDVDSLQNITITGTIRMPNDEPIDDAVITLRNLKDDILMEETTNRKGVFKLKDIRPKFYFLTIEHTYYGAKRIKINPRKNKNSNLDISIYLAGEEGAVDCYLFGPEPPTTFDPMLNIKDFDIVTSPENILVTWSDIGQAKLYTLYENNQKVYVGGETRFEKEVYPGLEHCYKLQASGNFELIGSMTAVSCVSAPTQSPRDIVIEPYRNTLSISWSDVEGAISYSIFRNDENIKDINQTTFIDSSLDFGSEYFYKIMAIDGMKNKSEPSIEIKSRTHEFVDVPILSSMNSNTNIVLIWNEVEGAKIYNIYKDDELLSSVEQTTFTDPMPPGTEYCYKISCIDQYEVETELSAEYCTKVKLDAPKGLLADADVTSMHLNWDEVVGADYYMIYEKIDNDSVKYVGESRSNQYTVGSLEFSEDICFVVTSIDMEGEESDFSSQACNVVFDPPHFTIQTMKIIEPSGNGNIDAREKCSMQFAIFNDGQSPAHNVIASVLPRDPDISLIIGDPVILDTLQAGRIKYVNIDIQGLLELKTGVHELELHLSSMEKIELDSIYIFTVETKSMVPPKMIIADYAVSNDFGTNYIPKNETAKITLRIQNVGEGETESVFMLIKNNRTYSMEDFNGKITLPAFSPGDYMDIDIPIKTSLDNFAFDLEMTDYLSITSEHRINIETMYNYRSPMELTIQDIGADGVIHYPDELGEIDVDRSIPIGRKNPNGLAVIIATPDYEDKTYKKLEHADRDRDVVRKYFRQAFGFSDFQILPSKPWQMEGGPSGDEYDMIFDPYDGDLKKRVSSAEKYSDVDEIDLYVYYRGYGEWVNGRPLLIPRDAKHDRDITKFPLEDMLSSLSRLAVLESIKTITLFLDITYLNPESSLELLWDYPDLPEKISILSSSSNGETSQVYNDKKHSFFTYSLLKGMTGNADDGDNVLNLGELVEYVYKTVPENIRSQPGAIGQNPKFNGMDMKRKVFDLR